MNQNDSFTEKLALGAAISVASTTASIAHWRYDAPSRNVALAAVTGGVVAYFLVQEFAPATKLANTFFSFTSSLLQREAA